jgi:hypothetical protein
LPNPNPIARPTPLAARAARGTLAACATLAALWPTASQAGAIELKVAPLISRTPSGPCPQTLTLVETHQPYREGSYGVNGRAPLETIATGWRLDSRDAFSATWLASLRPAWRQCQASAGVVRFEGNPEKGHSYLRLRFYGGQVRLILDMTGMRDPNTYTPAILSAGVSQGVPVWSWGGTD